MGTIPNTNKKMIQQQQWLDRDRPPWSNHSALNVDRFAKSLSKCGTTLFRHLLVSPPPEKFMAINVSVRVVGNYFGSLSSVTKTVTVSVAKTDPNVYDVLVEVSKAVRAGAVPDTTGFTFDPPFPGPTDMLNSITIDYAKPPKAGLDAGIYFLQEVKTGNPDFVFQYYIYSKDRVQKNFDSVFHPFNSPPPVPIEDGDIIIWRLVAILHSANRSRRVMAEMQKDSDTLAAL